MEWNSSYTVLPKFACSYDKQFKYPFFTDVLKFPLHTYEYYAKAGEEMIFLLYLELGKKRKRQVINNWQTLDLSGLSVKSRKTYLERIARMIQLGLAVIEGDRLCLRKKDRIIQGDIRKEKFVRVHNDKLVKQRIHTEILNFYLRRQGHNASQTELRQVGATYTVLTKIGDRVREDQTSPSYTTSISCIAVAELFGYSSSYSGWVILNKLKEAGFIGLYKRYVPIEESYRSANWRKQKMCKPILIEGGRRVNPISSEIEIKMVRAKRGVSGLMNPKNRFSNYLNSLYGDVC